MDLTWSLSSRGTCDRVWSIKDRSGGRLRLTGASSGGTGGRGFCWKVGGGGGAPWWTAGGPGTSGGGGIGGGGF